MFTSQEFIENDACAVDFVLQNNLDFLADACTVRYLLTEPWLFHDHDFAIKVEVRRKIIDGRRCWSDRPFRRPEEIRRRLEARHGPAGVADVSPARLPQVGPEGHREEAAEAEGQPSFRAGECSAGGRPGRARQQCSARRERAGRHPGLDEV